MSDCSGWIVRSKAGHDKGTLLCVVGEAEDFLLLADGKTRKAAAPKAFRDQSDGEGGGNSAVMQRSRR